MEVSHESGSLYNCQIYFFADVTESLSKADTKHIVKTVARLLSKFDIWISHPPSKTILLPDVSFPRDAITTTITTTQESSAHIHDEDVMVMTSVA